MQAFMVIFCIKATGEIHDARDLNGNKHQPSSLVDASELSNTVKIFQ